MGADDPYKFISPSEQDRHEEDTVKTFYSCNTRSEITRVFEMAGFSLEHPEMVEKEPSYLMKYSWSFIIGLLYERLVNSAKQLEGLRANIFAVFKKI